MFEKAIARIEGLMKGMLFDCHACGQCVLRQTGLICPMSCPKGLRNGPCGGTLDGKCEVYPDRQCVWIRIHHRTAKGDISLPQLLPSPDARLVNTSSYLNYLKGTDQNGRRPLAYLDLPRGRRTQPLQTDSRLEAKLKSGRFVRTCELRAPRSAGFERFQREAAAVGPHFDAVNVTAFLNARPSVPSPIAAAHLVRLGVEPVCQSTCRDHTKTSFISELVQNQMNQVANVLCLTGDSYAGVPKIKQVFDMDSSLMIYEARHLRETGLIHFTGEKMANPPRPFLGGAMNPYTTPEYVPIRRLAQKVAAGVDFIQTQVVFDVDGFAAFMKRVREAGLDQEVFILAGVPVVTSARALAVLPQIPGVKLPEDVKRRLEQADDIAAAGIELARQTVRALYDVPGLAGVHLMLFGPDHAVLPPIVADLPDKVSHPSAAAAVDPVAQPAPAIFDTEEPACPSRA